MATQSTYSALSALRVQQYNIDTIAANLSNVNTFGYKASRVEFKDALYTQMKHPMEAQNYLQAGSGALVGGTSRSFDTGTAMPTGRTLDLMLTGSGYLTVADGQGNVFYTRSGALEVGTIGGQNYLTTGDGYFVLNSNGNPVQLTGDPEKLVVDANGNLSMAGAPLGKLALADFVNPEGLSSAGGGRFVATAASGPAIAARNLTIGQGSLEGSNVDMALEMSRMIESQRLYAMLGRSITTTDEMDGNVIALGR